MTKPKSNQQNGFALVVVLILLVVLTLLAGTVALATQSAIDGAQAELDAFEGELDMVSTRETFLFMMSTQRQTIGGISTGPYVAPPAQGSDELAEMTAMPTGDEIRLDGRAYQGIGSTHFSFQDDRGLISLNWAGTAVQNAYLASLGVAAERYVDYADTLEDYQDADDLRRLNGAERQQYERAGMFAPSNQPLTTPLELRRVMGWAKLIENQEDDKILGMLTISRDMTFNINTAPAEVLAMLPGMDEANAQRMVDARNQAPFTSTYDAVATFPLNAVPEEALNLFANQSGNLILWNRQAGTRRLLHWTLSTLPNGLPPWRIDYEIQLPRDEDLDQAQVTTPATALFAPSGTTEP